MENLRCYMQQVSKVNVLLLIIRRLLSPVAAGKETLCVVLCIEIIGIILMAVVLLISLAAYMHVLGTRVQVFCKSITGVMCD